jgi:hypothetical protein
MDHPERGRASRRAAQSRRGRRLALPEDSFRQSLGGNPPREPELSSETDPETGEPECAALPSGETRMRTALGLGRFSPQRRPMGCLETRAERRPRWGIPTFPQFHAINGTERRRWLAPG